MNDATTFADVSIEAAIGKAEIMDNLKGMTCAQVYKIQMTNPYIHDPKTPTNFYKPRVIPEHAIMNKHKHVHADLMAAYAADAMTTDKPWERWESCGADWFELKSHPAWNETHEYRRKTNAQIACDMLGQAHDALEEHSAEICEPNVDHIQKLVWDAMQLLAKGE
jgi:hypothetical protein